MTILQAGCRAKGRQLERIVTDRAHQILGVRNAVDINYAVDMRTQEGTGPRVIALLASAAAAKDSNLESLVQWARREMVAVLPLFEPGERFEDGVPPSALPINGMAWTDDRTVADEVLRQLAITEEDRKVFLSYRRSETQPLVDQLRSNLIDRGFEVFVDRFSVKPGRDFQEVLNDALGDKAFMVLLESGCARQSEWVEHEVSFAHLYGLGILPLALPGLLASEQFEVIPPLTRHYLKPTHFSTKSELRLRKAPLRRVLEEVESRHSIALRLRRENLVQSVRSFLLDADFEVESNGQWLVTGRHTDGRAGVFCVTPRSPLVGDLHQLHGVRAGLGDGSARGFLVHDTPISRSARSNVLSWAIAERPLAVVPLLSMPAALKAWR